MHITWLARAFVVCIVIGILNTAANRRSLIRRLNSDIQEKDRQIQNLRNQLSAGESRFRNLRGHLAQLESRLQQIVQSSPISVSRLRLDQNGRLIEEP